MVILVKVIGLTGSIGSGKSTVAKRLQEQFHAYVISSDEVAKQLMEPGQISYKLIVEHFGTEILNEDASINRKMLASVVFADNDKLILLNSLTHPYVEQEILDTIQTVKTDKKYRMIVVETALLFQANYDRFCDAKWVVVANDDVRRQRLKSSRGYSDEKIDSVLAKQMTNDEFRSFTADIIDNSGDIKNIDLQIQNMLEHL